MDWHFPPQDEIEGQFKEYIEGLEPKFKGWIEIQVSTFDDILHLLETYYYYLNFIADSRILTGAHQGTLMIASRTATDLLGIYNCLKNGCIYQATILLRSLFETTVTTKFIYQEFNTRMDLFYQHRYFEQYMKLQKDPTVIEQYKHADIGQKYNEIKGKYDKNKPWYHKMMNSLIQNDLKMKVENRKANIRTMADIVGMKVEYEKLYGSLSLSVHGSTVLDHLFVNNGNFTAAPIFNSQLIYTDASLAVNYCHLNLETILSIVQHDDSAKLIEYSTWLFYATLKLAQSKIVVQV